MIYIVQHRYSSALGGPWAAGQEMELSEAEAARFNVDSPGVLKLKAAVEPKADAETRQAEPEKTRQVKAANKNR
jgi:hypothetical protein